MPLNSSLKNLSPKSEGFRIYNNSKSKKSIEIEFRVDDDILEKGYHINEIQSFYFDNHLKTWRSIQKDTIDIINQTYKSTFTLNNGEQIDYINGVIETPDHPESNSFASTKISDIDPVQPSAGLNIMSPPKASQTGEANISYPIELPLGRNGMIPNLNLSYNSDAQSSWLGLGWDLKLPSIDVNPKWGVPKFDPNKETEIYNLNGEMLIYENGYLPHRHEGETSNPNVNLINRTSDARFYTRRMSDQTIIERLGNSPSTYHWKVTNINGTVFWYGGDNNGVIDNAVLKDGNGNIVNWCIVKEIDVHGNYVEYTYDNNNLNEPSTILDGGKYIYPKTIAYTKFEGDSTLGNYEVEFVLDTNIRQNPSVLAHRGFKEIDPFLLDELIVKRNDELIRKYKFNYDDTGRFHKTLLSSVGQYDESGALFYDHEFEYYDDVAEENGEIYSQQASTTISQPNFDFTFLDLNPSLISTTQSLNYRLGIRPAFGMQFFVSTNNESNFFTIGTNIDYSNTASRGRISLDDINGDGIQDIIYKNGNGIEFFSGSLSLNNNNLLTLEPYSGSSISVNGINHFYRANTEVKPGLNNLSFFSRAFNTSISANKSKTTTDVYMTDANNDGLIDIVAEENVLFNHIGNDGQPTFDTDSSLSENMLITGGDTSHTWNDPNEQSEIQEDDQVEEQLNNIGDFDATYVWIAPADGDIQIEGRLRNDNSYQGQPTSTSLIISGETQRDNLNGGQPFRFFFRAAQPTFNYFNIDSYNPPPFVPLGITTSSNTLDVVKGQRIFLRHLAQDNVNSINITYSINYLNGHENLNEEFNNGNGNFLLDDKPVFIQNPNITLDIDWDQFDIVNPKDDIIFRIRQVASSGEQILYERTAPANQSTTIDSANNPADPLDNGLDLTNLINEPSIFIFSVKSDTEINYKNPNSTNYNTNFSAISNWEPVLSNAGEDFFPVPKHSTFWMMTSQGNTNLIANSSWSLGAGTLIANPTGLGQTIPNINEGGDFLFAVEKYNPNTGNIDIITKVIINIDDFGNIFFIENDDDFYTGNAQVIDFNDHIRFNFYAVGEHNQELMEEYFNLVGHDTSVIIENITQGGADQLVGANEFYDSNKHLGSMVGNRGMFFYNDRAGEGNGMPEDNYSRLIDQESVFNYDTPDLTGFINGSFDQNTDEQDILDDINFNPPAQDELFNNDGTPNNDFNFEEFAADLDNLAQEFNNTIPIIEVLPGTPEYFDENGLEDRLVGILETHRFNTFSLTSHSGAFDLSDPSSAPGAGSVGTAFEDQLDDSFDEPLTAISSDSTTGMKALDQIARSRSFAVSAGFAGVGNLSHINTIYNYQSTSFTDFNGDGYPDHYYPDKVFYTSMTGGHVTEVDIPNLFFSEHSNPEEYFKITNASASNVVQPAMGYASSKIGLSSDAIGAGLNFSADVNGETENDTYYIDVNGDGLADRIDTSGDQTQIVYNIGSFGDNALTAFENLNNLSRNTTSLNISTSANLGFVPGGNIPLNFNAGLTTNSSNLEQMYTDINGDGLVDIVNLSGNGSQINFNKGNEFSTINDNINQGLEGSSETLAFSGSVRGSLFYGWPICCGPFPILYAKVGVTGFGDVSLSYNKTERTFKDVNGDGYVDFIQRDGDDMDIFYSQIGRTNKLKTVHNPIKGSFTLDYEPQIRTYGNPNTKWALTHVEINNGYDFDVLGENKIRKDFEYHNGKYDRREREFLGYEEVRTLDYFYDENGETEDLYRGKIDRFHNQNYHLKSLLKESIVFRGEAPEFGEIPNEIFSKSSYTYELHTFDSNNEIDFGNNIDFTFDTGGQEGRARTTVLLKEKQEDFYEFGSSNINKIVQYDYDELGNIIKVIDGGDTSTSADDFETNISYHNPQIFSNHLIGIPKTISVLDNTGLEKRFRETSNINLNTGQIGEMKMKIDANSNATYTLEYDIFGNLNFIEYPENQNGEKVNYSYVYDTEEQTYVEQITDHFEYVSTFDYEHKYGNLIKETDYAANEVDYTYDDKGRLINILAPYEKDADEQYTIKFEYNLNPDIQIQDPNNPDFVPYAITTHNSHKINDNGEIKTYTFIDGLNRLLQIKQDHVLENSNNVMLISGWNSYDQFGRTIETNHPNTEPKDENLNKVINLNLPNNNFPSTFTYDSVDREFEITNPEATTTTMLYGISNDIEGQNLFITRVKSPQNNAGTEVISDKFTDVRGRIIHSRVLGEENMSVTNTYNSINELIEYKDEQGLTTSYEYDMLGRTLNIQNTDFNTIEFEYDNASNLITKRTANLIANDEAIIYTYDFNRPSEIIYPQINGNANIANVTYQYGETSNETGRLISYTDATGMMELEYGKMGEVTQEKRTIVAPNLPTREFVMTYEYDSWNRLLNMVYPDGEKVLYAYNPAGFLNNITGIDDNEIEYIQDIWYDKFGNRTQVLLGNGNRERFSYSSEMQRLKEKLVFDTQDNMLFRRQYDYDLIGNISGYKGLAEPYSAGNQTQTLGGTYDFSFTYDQQNRLSTSIGVFNGAEQQQEYGNTFTSIFDLEMAYNSTGGITSKTQNHNQNSAVNTQNTYKNDYKYYEGTHKVKEIVNQITDITTNFNYDLNGNMVNVNQPENFNKNYYWDEENRLRVLQDNELMHHYIYDANGERVLKSSSNFIEVEENGTVLDQQITFDNYTTYASPQVVIDASNNYTKHYFEGSTRIATRLGGNASIFEVEGGSSNNPAPNIKGQSKPFDAKTLQDGQISDLNYYFKLSTESTQPSFKPFKEDSNNNKDDKLELQNIIQKQDDGFTEAKQKAEASAIFYYHADHLGSNEIISDDTGAPHEFHLTLPFGETMAEQRKPQANYYNSWKFTGKELDEETGLYYFGARYYQPSWSVWLGVDPLVEKYKPWNPYNYTMNNPIRLIDPDGRGVMDIYKLNRDGRVEFVDKAEGPDILYATDDSGEIDYSKKISVNDNTILKNLSKERNDFDGRYTTTDNKKDAFNVFYFSSVNSKSEFALNGFSTNGKKQYSLTSSLDTDYTKTFIHHKNMFGFKLKNHLFDLHSHPNDGNIGASGYSKNYGPYGDRLYYMNKVEPLLGIREPAPHYMFNIDQKALFNYDTFKGDTFIRRIEKASDLYRKLGF